MSRVAGRKSGGGWERRGPVNYHLGMGEMTEAEAREILGVGADATTEEMQEDYRKLMRMN